MFADLEESVYDQLYSDLRHSSTPTNANTSTPPPPRYISLALVFGTTFTTPKEQYMLRIGPLEPRLPSPSSSTPSSAYTHNPNSRLPAPLPTATMISPEEQANRTREEKKWDRLLIQNLLGILPPSPPSDLYPSSDRNQRQQEGYGGLLGTDPLRHRTKTHLLMRAPAGKIFTDMLPQQHLLLHQDYPTPSPSSLQIDEDGQEEEVSATQSCWNQGCRNHKKPARWPIHHIHIFGPSPAVTSDQEQEQDLPHTDNHGMNEDKDEMWYLIGPGIPLLSPLL